VTATGARPLVIDALTRRFGTVTAVSALSLEVRAGEIVGFLGANGAGKTTTLRCASGLLAPDQGRIEVAGADLEREPRVAKARLGLVPDRPFLYERLSAREFLAFVAALYDLPADAAARRAEDLLTRLALAEHADRTIEGYSLGMRQKTAIAAALLHSPPLLLLDEPLNGLDPLVRAETIALFRTLAREGRHVIVSTHILHEVDMISDQVILLNGGYILAEGEIKTVRDEIEEHPMQILIRCTRPQALASKLFENEHVVEARLHSDGAGLLVKTRTPERFYLALNRIALTGIDIEAVAPADDDANSVYEYLIGEEPAR